MRSKAEELFSVPAVSNQLNQLPASITKENGCVNLMPASFPAVPADVKAISHKTVLVRNAPIAKYPFYLTSAAEKKDTVTKTPPKKFEPWATAAMVLTFAAPFVPILLIPAGLTAAYFGFLITYGAACAAGFIGLINICLSKNEKRGIVRALSPAIAFFGVLLLLLILSGVYGSLFGE